MVSVFLFIATNLFSQTNPSYQDPTLNNLVHPKGYKSCKIGELGSVKKYGKGKKPMIIVAGMGFSDNEYSGIISNYKKEFTVYFVTPAGFGKTKAPNMPDTSVKYASMAWTYGIVDGILKLISKEKLNKPVVIAHFINATHVALKLASDYPDKISKIVILSGSPYRYYAMPKNKSQTEYDWEKEYKMSAKQRSMITETFMAPKWFKTVTEKTWDSFMWTANDYCKDSLTGNQLFKSIANIPMQILIRYMIEWGAYDDANIYQNIKVPTLILIPDFKGILDADPKDTISCNRASAKQYLKYYFQFPWEKAKSSGNSLIQTNTVPDTRLFMWYDRPKEVYQIMSDFLTRE
ncbi:MAG: alpha/beta hydrolase [Bacteroidetes bacterium]|nr:alpha/beta hydrolase [Bacteroidota bacterium]